MQLKMRLAELKTALEGEDAEDIQKKVESLTEVSMKLGEAIYKSSMAEQAQAEGEATTSEAANDDTPKDEDVVDADFEEVEETEEAEEDNKKSA